MIPELSVTPFRADDVSLWLFAMPPARGHCCSQQVIDCVWMLGAEPWYGGPSPLRRPEGFLISKPVLTGAAGGEAEGGFVLV